MGGTLWRDRKAFEKALKQALKAADVKLSAPDQARPS
jgi:hypothetical protein